MSYLDALKRAAATFAQAATATLIAGGLSDQISDVALWQRAGIAGAAALVALVHRASQAYLDAR